METTRYIQISPNVKVFNPTHDSPLFTYAGPIEKYNFAHQQKNYEKIQEILEAFNKKLSYIYVGRFMGDKKQKTIFLAHNQDKSVWWRKYESKTEGSGQNLIYFKNGNTIKTTRFLSNPHLFIDNFQEML